MPRLLRIVPALVTAAVLAAVLLVVGGASPGAAHEEREASFPDGTGTRPTFLGYDNDRRRVVCRPTSARRIAAMPDGRMRRVSRGLLDECRFGSIQTAINSVRRRGTSIYVLPGRYSERRWATKPRTEYCSNLATESADPLRVSSYIGSISEPGERPEADGLEAAAEGGSDPIALSYADQRRCPGNLNLISVFGDETPRNRSIRCDSEFCGLQIVGTGARMTDVVIDNRFQKLNAIRADRAGGIVIRNLTAQQAEFNAVYVLETDGFRLDRLTTRGNDEYGILAFASDHGLITRTDNYYNGDSGIYPGSASDLNGDNTAFEPTRYAIEIRGNRSHHNTLGYSGTAGNSVWAHHNRFYDNATGIATDSLFPGHPGLPQDHARWSRNEIFGNNTNYYTEYVDEGVCDRPMAERGYLDGVVCPVVPVPVGTGVLIAGGNYNSTDHNWIYDNWRAGTMQFWVPAPLRDEYDPEKLYDTSHHNHTVANRMGIAPDGTVAHNGLDHWWDDQGEGNCWEGNTYSRGERTDNFTLAPPSCGDGGSPWTPGLTVKDAGFLSCSQYDRSDPLLRHPPACEWFETPADPMAEAAARPISSGPEGAS
ncbi:MAG: right-handed parallel beta-helix repeat-containing protein, partial [Nocardioides sp.]